ncbi:uncharacterized protein LOC113510156 [Galleria mellonella]|uniref:Uncharacterized protein LOC113510156 n=1 Tax=Galleria mellonella TaxID=7137 RepID=A0A6J1W8V8_GALME|nr:uncharacterized protein LOC113510156 [Galleria mellonella]
MALYMKQDFNPPILSRKWLAIKCRPNMLLYSRHHIIAILESGLLFREDSIEVEQEAPSTEEVWRAVGGGKGGWFTKGEGIAALLAVSACVAAFPPRSLHRWTLANLAAYVCTGAAVRAAHRALCRGSLAALLASMRDYLALARRAAACLKEYAALHAQLGSISCAIESTHTMLRRQQSELSVLMSRASSALLGNAPWLVADVAWDAVVRDGDDNLTKIHHAFLVVQSTLLKHIAMAHYIPSIHAQRIYRNHNERIYWLHATLIPHLTDEFQQCHETLNRMYRLLKNFGSSDIDNKKLGTAVIDSWMYSDIHSGIARTCLELKLSMNKCNSLDAFLDSCALNNQELDLNVLSNDIGEIIDSVTKSLTTMQNSQLRLKKIKNKCDKPDSDVPEEVEAEIESAGILKIEDKEPEAKDEVFYFVRTDDDVDSIQPAGDSLTGPGKKERETTKVVLSELRRKLGKREDAMRERERRALLKTMPELKDNVPEFPKQIGLEEYADQKGFIRKIKRKRRKTRLFKNYKINQKRVKIKKYKLKRNKYEKDKDIVNPYEANSNLIFKSKLITIVCNNKELIIIKWCKHVQPTKSKIDKEKVGNSAANKVNGIEENKENSRNNYKVSKRDLELSPSSSESDFEFYERQVALLKDARRHRANRKKQYPDKRASIDKEDESLRPIEYSFGTGMAMASMLQTNSKAKIPNMCQEEVFIGDGEVSNDSGNDEDA